MKIFSDTIDGRRMPEYDCDGFPITLSLSEIKKFIREAPTAYDVDAVIYEISSCFDSKKEVYTDTDSDFEFGKAMAYRNAIEIVRNGGK